LLSVVDEPLQFAHEEGYVDIIHLQIDAPLRAIDLQVDGWLALPLQRGPQLS